MKRINDAFLFAREARVLQGTVPVSGMERLHDLLVEVAGETFALPAAQVEEALVWHDELAAPGAKEYRPAAEIRLLGHSSIEKVCWVETNVNSSSTAKSRSPAK